MTEFLLCVVMLLFATKICGMLFMKCGQPKLIGEIIAGIIIGPTFLMQIFDDASSIFLENENPIYLLGQLGLVFYMYIIGTGMKNHFNKNNIKLSIKVSLSGILGTLIFSFIASLLLYEILQIEGNRYGFAGFMALALSITAFPVLAMILEESKLINKNLKSLALMVGSIDEIIAWILLGGILIFTNNGGQSIQEILIIPIYLILMLAFGKKLMLILFPPKNSKISFVIIIILFNAFITNQIGLHSALGGLLIGILLPDEVNKHVVSEIQGIVRGMFLPIFFSSIGLTIDMKILFTSSLLFPCIIYLLIAFIGKQIVVSLVLKFEKFSWVDSLNMGILVNIRGLMIIVLGSIGRDYQIINDQVFCILVLIGIVTTVVATPVIKLLQNLLLDKDNKTSSLLRPGFPPSSRHL